jgi:hypothetical protein
VQGAGCRAGLFYSSCECVDGCMVVCVRETLGRSEIEWLSPSLSKRKQERKKPKVSTPEAPKSQHLGWGEIWGEVWHILESEYPPRTPCRRRFHCVCLVDGHAGGGGGSSSSSSKARRLGDDGAARDGAEEPDAGTRLPPASHPHFRQSLAPSCTLVPLLTMGSIFCGKLSRHQLWCQE